MNSTFVGRKSNVMAKKRVETDSSTEEKIKAAAQKVFTKKGFSGARTRDIAEEAGINLALLNYYFRSKEKLFDIVMMENLQQFLLGLKSVLHNEKSSLTEKVSVIAEEYINMLTANPDLPLFVLTEIRTNPEKLADTMKVKTLLLESVFFKQLMEATKGKIHPLHLLINIMGLTVFPFIAGPLLQHVGNMKTKDFHNMMDERKKLIPIWFDSIIKGI
ncbi:MAG TPA: TetR/AcrR family transcriptional regulator [Cyclobacteriaceae bacterium]